MHAEAHEYKLQTPSTPYQVLKGYEYSLEGPLRPDRCTNGSCENAS